MCQRVITVVEYFSGLQKLPLIWKKTYKKDFINFMRQQRNLRKLTCCAAQEQRQIKSNTRKLMDFILNIPSLREFQLLFPGNVISWNSQWSTSLIASNIEILVIVCRKVNFTNTAEPCPHPKNQKLTTLTIQARKTLSSLL